jgi:hypothetical protein
VVLWILLGICGFSYSLIVARRLRLQKSYKPLLYDWVFYVAVPAVIYAILALSAYFTLVYGGEILFLVAAAVVALLLVSIHNTWDSITYLVFTRFAI